MKDHQAPGLDEAHDELSRLLQDEDAGNDEVRDAAIRLVAHLDDHRGMRTHLPPDPERVNHNRSRWAGVAISAFITQTGADFEDGLGDLLCDLMHWADRHNFDFEAALDRARGHYQVETTSTTHISPSSKSTVDA